MKPIFVFLILFSFGMLLFGGYNYMTQHSRFMQPLATSHFSLENAPSESLKGDIATMSGTVTWLSRVAAEPTRLRAPRMVQQGEALSTGNTGTAMVVIKDSVISLAPNSDISFTQLLPTNVVIRQNAGSVTFQSGSRVPLSVRSLDLITLMNNATMHIVIDKNTAEVTVEKGTVTEAYEDTDNKSIVVTVHAGQQFLFDNETQTGTIE